MKHGVESLNDEQSREPKSIIKALLSTQTSGNEYHLRLRAMVNHFQNYFTVCVCALGCWTLFYIVSGFYLNIYFLNNYRIFFIIKTIHS